MKFFVRLFIPLILAMLFPVLGMKKITTNPLKKNYFKSSLGTNALKYKNFLPKNYSSFAHLKFNKTINPKSKTLFLNNTTALYNKSLNRAYVKNINSNQTEKKEEIIDEKNNPKEAKEIVSRIIEEWAKKKPYVKRDKNTGFFKSDDPKKRNNDHNEETSQPWYDKPFFIFLGAVTVGIKIKELIWGKTIESGKKPISSEEPFPPGQIPSRYPKELYIYALDREMAKTMIPYQFVQKLHKAGLTVEDCVKIQCQIQEENAYKELTNAGNFSEDDWNLLHNILKLRHDLMKGNYNEKNVTFDATIDNDVMEMVKTALQKANVPFKVRVHTSTKGKNENTAGSGKLVKSKALTFKYHLATGTAGLFGNEVETELYLSPDILGNLNKSTPLLFDPKDEIKATIAHEVTHIANLHNLQSIYFDSYTSHIKKISNDNYNKCEKILRKIFEYQADILPLADPEYAQAQKGSWAVDYAKFTIPRSDIYVPAKKIFELSSIAVELHKAEKKIKK